MSDAPDIDLSALVEPVQAIAREAGRRILDVYAGAFGVTEKADQSPRTAPIWLLTIVSCAGWRS